jgi:U3 small nucleolar ribonucleoprotein protein IMP4
MTIVTTSRKPIPVLRTFAKDLAFALGGRYVPRGKTGLPAIISLDTDVVIVRQRNGKFSMEIYHGGTMVMECPFSSYTVHHRSGSLERGLLTGNQTVYQALNRYLDVREINQDPSVLLFDGVQRRRYQLRIQP